MEILSNENQNNIKFFFVELNILLQNIFTFTFSHLADAFIQS